MNATGELRFMLNKRGIEHTDLYTALGRDQITQWPTKDLLQATATEHEQDGTLLVTFYGSAEQAIEGTLGKGECNRKPHFNLTIGDDFLKQSGWDCSECGYRLDFPAPIEYCPNCGRKVRA